MSLSNGKQMCFPLNIGSRVRCVTTYNNVIEGIVVTFLKNANLLLVNSNYLPGFAPIAKSGENTINGYYTTLNLTYCKDVTLIHDTKNGAQEETASYATAEGIIGAAALAYQLAKMGVPVFKSSGVAQMEKPDVSSKKELAMQLTGAYNPYATPAARSLFVTFARLYKRPLDVRWENMDIIVLNLVRVMPPYTVNSIRYTPKKENLSYRSKNICTKFIRKIIKRFYAENPHFNNIM